MNLVSRITLLLSAILLTACSKTVQWEEEVPLNTGEVIWVKRTDTYVKGSEPGNPLKMTWGLEKRFYKFLWQKQTYEYEVVVKAGGPILIHAFEDRVIAIIDSAWPQCSGYGEYRWVDGHWVLQKNVSAEIVGRPRNLMAHYSAIDGDIPMRVTQEFIRNSRFDLPQNGGTATHLLASKISSNGSRSK